MRFKLLPLISTNTGLSFKLPRLRATHHFLLVFDLWNLIIVIIAGKHMVLLNRKMGGIWSFLFGRTVSVNGRSYRVIRTIGEGGQVLKSVFFFVGVRTKSV